MAATDTSAIDMNVGLQYYPDEQMFREQLSAFENMTLNPSLDLIHEAWKNNEYTIIERESGKLANACR